LTLPRDVLPFAIQCDRYFSGFVGCYFGVVA
jgi:hypothetical protein